MQANNGVLLQNGERVKLQEQPLQILLRLLETPGELVSREKLWAQLWPEKTPEESDRSLRVAATKLRQALGDNSTAPRYIETVTRRGYQFIGKVTPIGTPAPAEEPSQNLPDEQIQEQTPQPRYRPALLVLLLGLIALAATGLWLYRWHRAKPLLSINDSDMIVVGGVINSTGDHYFDGVLSSALQAKLEESPYLNLVPAEKFRRLVPDSDVASQQDELRACVSLHAQALLRGEILAQSPDYLLKVTVFQCSNGHALATQTDRAKTRDDVLQALNLASEQMRRTLNEPESSLQRFNVPLVQATTGSLGALKAFTQGEKKHLLGLESDSTEDYKLAIALDPEFALAYARLGSVYYNLEEYKVSQQFSQKAFDLREHATERERFYIVSRYYSGTGEIEPEIQTLQLWRKIYPRDPIAANNLADMYLLLGEPEKALGLAETAVQLNPEMDHAYTNLASADLRTGKYAALNQLCNHPIPGKTDSVEFRVACFQGAFAQNDPAGMQAQLEKAKNDPAESEMLASAAWAALYRGQMSQANHLFSEAEQNARANHLGEFAAEVSLDQAALEADLGFPHQSQALARNASHQFPESPTVQAYAALALARSGDTSDALTAATHAAAQAPSDTVLNFAVLASVRAAMQVHKGDPAAAIRELEETRPFDFCSFMDLSPAYYRGEAYLQTRQFDKAAEEFKRVIGQQASFPESPYLVLSQLELGRTFQLREDRVHADLAYRAVADTWKGADRGFPPLQQLHAYQREMAKQ
ncbi:winged helix-turn-helix domain-containing protein [Granulicella mallensis]|uniref:DNA-binding winged helix-turn-helix (WHTH) protein/tetratricopeptide (TPR) repeat protein n=1 Tax=Granulicella mallensis TaxID=940614 RepID=A0A7W8EBF0_9BACT|nr:winged helix-turn-helix domain-containing protein [Granulicella mallensis]MBB5064460.1 DNA-binding winged helix-turn-helix (wHTH) protein/tetratricopeptide (TPR) repeat protein [Granulicella mallensis]